jgi:hypothetical protein
MFWKDANPGQRGEGFFKRQDGLNRHKRKGTGGGITAGNGGQANPARQGGGGHANDCMLAPPS